jgi:hypothetical protein
MAVIAAILADFEQTVDIVSRSFKISALER